jgi:hypothetical protein
MWTLVDNTNGEDGGYYRIFRNGVRVCDGFPYARNTDAKWVLAQLEKIVETMNKAESLQSSSGLTHHDPNRRTR